MEALKQNNKTIFTQKLAKKILVILIFVLIFDFFLFPAPALAAEEAYPIEQEQALDPKEIEYLENLDKLNEINQYQDNYINSLPENDVWDVKRYNYHEITAYTSEAVQCDGSPCITANGFNLCEHGIEDSVAANFLAFGTKVRIPDLFGERVFVVRDRMNARYPDRVDIWFKEKTVAKKFGLKIAKIEVLE